MVSAITKQTFSAALSDEQFRTIADSAPFAIVITRLSDGSFIYVNDNYCSLLGVNREQLEDRAAWDIYADPEERKSIVEQLKNDGLVLNHDLQIKQSSNQSLLCVCFSARIGELNSEPITLASLYDITDRKKAEDKLRETAENLAQSNSELEQFAYIASHDLQEPLRMIGSYLQLLEQRYRGKLDKDADDFIHYAVDGATRLQRMINGLLVFSRVHTRGKEMASINAESALENALENLKLSITESGASITRDALPTVCADPTQLTLLFQNLLSDAIKFSGRSPKIHIAIEETPDFYKFCISDQGIGIDPKDAERIFVIFQKLPNREQYPGTGIGLAICRRIVARHGGRIWVESEEGKGSRFYFTLSKERHAG